MKKNEWKKYARELVASLGNGSVMTGMRILGKNSYQTTLYSKQSFGTLAFERFVRTLKSHGITQDKLDKLQHQWELEEIPCNRNPIIVQGVRKETVKSVEEKTNSNELSRSTVYAEFMHAKKLFDQKSHELRSAAHEIGLPESIINRLIRDDG